MHGSGARAPRPAALRYAARVVRARKIIVLASIIVAAGAAIAAATLPVKTDFSYLLPPSATSVRQLRRIEKRARAIGTVMLVAESDDPRIRDQAARALRDRAEHLGPELVSSITFDESTAREFAWEHRWLYASLGDLERARDALRDEIKQAKLEANPLYVDLDDQPAARGENAADELRAKLKDAEAKAKAPGELVSKDGRIQMMILHTGFSPNDDEKSTLLLERLDGILAQVRADFPGAQVGMAGDVVTTMAEHDAILNGMLIAIIVTVVLVLAALLLYYRSLLAVGALSWSLAVGTLITFAITRFTIGELNVATAFLSSIVVGNGINFGIILLARHMEEIRAGRRGVEGLAAAIEGSFKGTLAAAMTAAVAYASLIITDFRGFRHFGIIGGIGMVVCWISAFTVLPAELALVDGRIEGGREPRVGRILARLVPRRPAVVAAVMLVLVGAAGVETYRYLSGDPFEANFRNLRSDNAAIREEQRWMHDVDQAFGQGISGGFVIALPDRADVAPMVTHLRDLDRGKDKMHRLFSRLNTLDDMLPDDQAAKLKVLAEIRGLLTPEALDALSDADRKEALALRPPADLRALRDADVPEEMAAPFIEADGSRGKIILAMSGWGYEIWNARDLVRFSDTVRGLHLGKDTLLGGTAFVFADVLRSIESDGPRATFAAILGAILVVALVMGVGRHGAATLACGAAGTLFMLAIASLVGIRVNFLDFVALPITIGIGIDYAVNISARDREDGPGHARDVLHTVGGAVALCSYTTIVGYGSLLLSANKAIRSFGLAAILGEGTCLTAALILGPSLLWVLSRRGRTEDDAAPGPDAAPAIAPDQGRSR